MCVCMYVVFSVCVFSMCVYVLCVFSQCVCVCGGVVSSWPAKLMWFEGEPVLEGSSCAGCTSSHVGDMSDVHTVVNELVV